MVSMLRYGTRHTQESAWRTSGFLHFRNKGRGLTLTGKRKKIPIITAAIVVAALSVTACFFFLCGADKTKTIVQENEYIDLDVERDEETKGMFGYTAAFPWYSGTVRARALSTELYDDVTQVPGLSDDELSYLQSQSRESESGKSFMLVCMELENISAVLSDPRRSGDEPADVFLINFFSPVLFDEHGRDTAHPIGECVYFDRHEPFDALKENHNKGYFRVGEKSFQQGASLAFQLGFYLDEKISQGDSVVLKIGVSDQMKYGIQLNPKRK